jgi:hypothetical protein
MSLRHKKTLNGQNLQQGPGSRKNPRARYRPKERDSTRGHLAMFGGVSDSHKGAEWGLLVASVTVMHRTAPPTVDNSLPPQKM